MGSAFAVLGALIAFFVIPDVPRRLGDRDEAWKLYLQGNSWEANWGDDVIKGPSGVVLDQVIS